METAPAAAPSTPAASATAPPPAVEAKAPDKPAEGGKPADGPKHKVKIDGEEREVTLEELIRGYQTDAAGQKRLKDLAEKEKSVTAEKDKVGKAIAAAKAGDYSALRDLGLSDDEIEQLSIKVLSERQQVKLEEERRKALDPEKRELEDLRKEKEESAKKDKEREAADQQKQVESTKATLTGLVVNTLEILPEQFRASGVIANRVLEAWEFAIENAQEIEKRGVKVTPQFIAEKVRDELLELYKGLLTGAKDEDLEKYVPADVWERRAKKPAAPPGPDHPALAGKPQVREAGGDKTAPKKRMGDAAAMRHAITGKRPT